jgi:hypothetical protein
MSRDEVTPRPAAAWDGADRRKETRRATNTPARLFYGPRYDFWIDCVIKDRSERGAKIQAAGAIPLSPKLALLDYRAGVVFLAQHRWRKNDLTGLKLEVRHELAELKDEALAPIRLAWLALGPALRG